MKVVELSRNDEVLEQYDYQDFVEIVVDGVSEFKVLDGEPEDSNLSRNFSDCYNVIKLMKLAYEAGKLGEELEIIQENGEIK